MPACRCLMKRHGQMPALFGRDEVVVTLGLLTEIDLYPVDLAAELRTTGWIVVGDGRTEFVADVTGFVGGEDYGLGLIHTAFAGLLAVHVQPDRSALRQSAAVVGELHAH